jgi:hypothetical protein
MPFILRDTTNLKRDARKEPQAQLWKAFHTRARSEGHSITWLIWALIRQYVDHGIDRSRLAGHPMDQEKRVQ